MKHQGLFAWLLEGDFIGCDFNDSVLGHCTTYGNNSAINGGGTTGIVAENGTEGGFYL